MGNPWEDVPDLWSTPKAYLNWLRGQVRRIWSRHPIKHRYIANAPCVSVEEATKQGLPIGVKLTSRTKKLRQCEMCGQWFPPSYMEVDHIHGGEGFDNYEEFLKWQERMLFVGFADLRLLDKGCHQQVTLSQRYNCSLEDVHKYVQVAQFNKLPVAKQKKLLSELGLPEGSNATKRKEIYYAHTFK